MPKHIASEVAESLRLRIESGEWSASCRLPTERVLASEYRVARNTMRRAIDAIVLDGRVTRHVGRGTFLNAEARDDHGRVMQAISGASPVDMMSVRAIIEPRAAAMAAANASARELDEIAAAHQSSLAANDMTSFERWDAEIHQKIFAGSRNDLLNNLHELLRLIRAQAPWLDLKRRSFSEERRLVYCREHGAVVEALTRRDADAAAAAMRTHLETVSRNLFNNAAEPRV
jgi:DNA-binding FadR family transcriptional regulator